MAGCDQGRRRRKADPTNAVMSTIAPASLEVELSGLIELRVALLRLKVVRWGAVIPSGETEGGVSRRKIPLPTTTTTDAPKLMEGGHFVALIVAGPGANEELVEYVKAL